MMPDFTRRGSKEVEIQEIERCTFVTHIIQQKNA